ncbi:MAG: glycosyltransferase family 2 protein [Bacteroidales bacterium]|nr:glycosyltransferase family 2 protein [Bacteroidales bacterium]
MDFPKVTIGIPVYNEESNISATLDSLLQQDYKNYEILISDNNSTDKTVQIIEEYKKKHDNIKILYNNVNQGALENWNHLIRNAQSEYFMIAGSHDLISKNYVSSLISSLGNNSKAVLAYAKTVWIDEHDNNLNIPCGYVDTSGFDQIRRFNLVFYCNQHALYGLYRLSDLKKTRMQTPVFASGAILLNELSLIGDFVVNTKAIWYRRTNRNVETKEQRLSRYYRNLFTKKKIRVFPFLKVFIYYLSIPFLKNRLSIPKRILLFFNIFFLYILRYHYDLFIGDFVSIIRRTFKIRT